MSGISYCDSWSTWEFDRPQEEVIEYDIAPRNESDALDINESVSLGRSVLLSEPASSQACHVTLCCKETYRVSLLGLQVVSESRTLEVYDESNTYIQSARGEVIHDTEQEEKLYRCNILLQNPTMCISMKFLSLKDKKAFRVFKIKVHLKQEEMPTSPLPTTNGSINVDKVRTIMDELGVDVSQNAKDLMSNIEQYQKNQSKVMSDVEDLFSSTSLPAEHQKTLSGMSGIMSIFSRLSNQAHSGQTAKTNGTVIPKTILKEDFTESCDTDKMFVMLHSIAGSVSQMRNVEKGKQLVPPEQETLEFAKDRTSIFTDSPELKLVQDLLSCQLEQAEKRILSHVDERLKLMEERINSKLDTILTFLQGAHHNETNSTTVSTEVACSVRHHDVADENDELQLD